MESYRAWMRPVFRGATAHPGRMVFLVRSRVTKGP